MTSCGHAIAALAIMAAVVMAAPDVDAVMYERPEGVQEAAWSEEGSPQNEMFQAEEDPSVSLQRKEALADAHVKEDQASLLLSTDAQALEHLKGQMSLEVVRAKGEIAAHPRSPSAHAHRAAAIAKQVLKKTSKVQKDQSKERLAKIAVGEAQKLLQSDQQSAATLATDKKKKKNYENHLARAAAKLKGFKKKDSSKADKMPPTSDDKDPISRELGLERDKYRSSEHTTALAVEKDKHDVAGFETLIQSLTDKLNKAKSSLSLSTAQLRKHMRSHAVNEHLFQKYSKKETHYKKMHALKAKIARQEDNLRLQQMKIRDSKEMLTKSLNNERVLASVGAKRTHRVQRRAARLGVHRQGARAAKSTAAPFTSPAVSAAVDAVSSNLNHQNIAKELAPQIEKLKASGLKGARLKNAIDGLVAKTVKTKVSAAFKQDPHVASAVRNAAQQVQSRRAKKETDLTLASAKKHVDVLHTAGQQLAHAEHQLDHGLDEEEMIQQLEEEWGNDRA
jgi:hypothetical protein